MNHIRQGTIISREDGYACAWYEIKTRSGEVLAKAEEDRPGQTRLDVGQAVFFSMEAGKVGYFATNKPGKAELLNGVIKKSHLYGDEQILLYIITETAYHIARPYLSVVFGELGQRMTKEQRLRLVKSLEGQPYLIRPWPRAPWYCDLIQPRPRRRRKTGPPRLVERLAVVQEVYRQGGQGEEIKCM